MVGKARRENGAKPAERLSRGSFGEIRISDRFDDMNNLDLGTATEYSFGERTYERHGLDHNEVAVSMLNTGAMRCLEIGALVDLPSKTIVRGISLMRQ